MTLSLEHILILALVVFFCYYFMCNCSCVEGVKFNRNNLSDRITINNSNPEEHCVKCGSTITAALITSVGVDEIPVVGEATMLGEGAIGAYQCGSCGLNIGETLGCLAALRDDGQTDDARMCTCTDGKICTYGTGYRKLENTF